MFVERLKAFADAPGQSARVFLSCGTQLIFCAGEVVKIGGPPPFKRDPGRIAALVGALPQGGGPPVICVELRRPEGRELVDACGEAFGSLEAREAALGRIVDPLRHWSGGYEARARSDRRRDAPPRVMEADLFGGAF